MSRIGKQVIILPKQVQAKIEESIVYISGPKGDLSYKISHLIGINLDKDENKISLQTKEKSKTANELHGLSRSIINNMVIGVSKGFEKKLVIQGVGYRSQTEGKTLILNVGYSHPVNIVPPEDISIKVDNNTNITVTGANKETVGQIAAKIRATRPPEPYKGKGIRYKNEQVRRKVGKAGK